MLDAWAERLLQAQSPCDVVALHVNDNFVAFLTGLRTKEGQAVARFFGGRAGSAETIAAASAISRLSECDDIHLRSCVTAGAAVIPVALALDTHRDGDAFARAVSAGYAAGLALGSSIGGARALASGTWPSLLAAPLMAAVTASVLCGHDAERLAHAMALALAGSSGRPGRPEGSPSGRWYLFGEAVARGLSAADAAGAGFCGDLSLLSKSWLAGHTIPDAVDMSAFDAVPSSPSISDAGFKPFPIARQAANALFAFRKILAAGMDARRIRSVDVFVPAMNAGLLQRPLTPDDRLSRLSNMGFQFACAAFAPEALHDAERGVRPDLLEFARLVTVRPTPDLEKQLPDRWAARVAVVTPAGTVEETVVSTPFDADAPDLTQTLNEKWRSLTVRGYMAALFDAPFSHAMLWEEMAGRIGAAARNEAPKD